MFVAVSTESAISIALSTPMAETPFFATANFPFEIIVKAAEPSIIGILFFFIFIPHFFESLYKLVQTLL